MASKRKAATKDQLLGSVSSSSQAMAKEASESQESAQVFGEAEREPVFKTEQNMASKRNSATSDPLDCVSSSPQAMAEEAEISQESAQTEREAASGPGRDEAYDFARSLYLQQYYAAYMNQMLHRGLTGIHSELNYMSRKLHRLNDHVKECSDTLDFYVTRMLTVQKDMLHAVGKSNRFLETAVHLLHDIKENQGCSNAAGQVEPRQSFESSEDGSRRKEQEKRHRSRSDNCGKRRRSDRQ